MTAAMMSGNRMAPAMSPAKGEKSGGGLGRVCAQTEENGTSERTSTRQPMGLLMGHAPLREVGGNAAGGYQDRTAGVKGGMTAPLGVTAFVGRLLVPVQVVIYGHGRHFQILDPPPQASTFGGQILSQPVVGVLLDPDLRRRVLVGGRRRCSLLGHLVPSDHKLARRDLSRKVFLDR